MGKLALQQNEAKYDSLKNALCGNAFRVKKRYYVANLSSYKPRDLTPFTKMSESWQQGFQEYYGQSDCTLFNSDSLCEGLQFLNLQILFYLQCAWVKDNHLH